jgi:hypothetical protein
MTWQSLLQAQRIKPHRTSLQNSAIYVVERDLQDAGVTTLSADRRFATAYNAVLHLAKIVIAWKAWRAGFGPREASASLRQRGTKVPRGLKSSLQNRRGALPSARFSAKLRREGRFQLSQPLLKQTDFVLLALHLV